MVRGFKITTDDFLTITQVKRAIANLPAAMESEVKRNNPLDVRVTPKTDKVKLAMYKDKLSGKKGEAIRQNYLNTFLPFLKGYVKNMAKLEVKVYD